MGNCQSPSCRQQGNKAVSQCNSYTPYDDELYPTPLRRRNDVTMLSYSTPFLRLTTPGGTIYNVHNSEGPLNNEGEKTPIIKKMKRISPHKENYPKGTPKLRMVADKTNRGDINSNYGLNQRTKQSFYI